LQGPGIDEVIKIGKPANIIESLICFIRIGKDMIIEAGKDL
jgi:hypothetical protein